MKRFFTLLFSVVIASSLWTGCNPEDKPLDPPVVSPPDPNPGTTPGTGGENTEDKLTYDNLTAYDCLRNYVDRTAFPDFKLGAAVTEKPINRLSMPEGAIIGGIIRGEDSYIATGNFQIQAEDRVVVLVLPKTIQAVEKLFR